MTFRMLSREQQTIRESVLRLCAQFGDAYWLDHDASGAYPAEFARSLAGGGWLGIAMPTEHGGSGLGILDAAVMMQAIAESGAGLSGASAVHINIFAPRVIVRHGTTEQKARFLPPLISGEHLCSFGVTEPDSGLDTSSLRTMATRASDRDVIKGQKIWNTLAQRAAKILILARTTPREQCARATDGMSLFFADFDRSRIEVREIDKMGRKCVDSNGIFIDGLGLPKSY